MNIVGEGFDPKIIEQINVRQTILGSINKTNEELVWMNSKTAWVKIASSVNITQAGIRELPYTGNELAKNFILFNGVTSNITGKNPRAGIWDGEGLIQNKFNDYAYGVGGTEFGLRPMPGVNNVEIKTETRGSLKTATIQITAYNRIQFDIIDLLYMRLGYSVLVEWGNSSYFETKDKFVEDNQYSLTNDFLNGNLKYDTYLQTINKARLESYGNYDALIGKVVNFNWNFNPDGSYSITLIIRSMGDVIESLKTNILLPGGEMKVFDKIETTQQTNPPSTTPPEQTPEDVIKAFSNSHEIGKLFYSVQQQLTKESPNNAGFAFLTSNVPSYTGYDDTQNSIAFVKQIYSTGETQYYIKLSYLLGFLQDKIIPNVDNEQVKLLKINNRVNTNIIYNLPRQISCNPSTCQTKTSFGDGKQQFLPGADDFYIDGSGGYKFKGNYYGYLMNVYFNFTFILEILDKLKDDKGKVSLYDLLQNICKGYCDSTGNINSIEPIVNTETNEIVLIDSTSLPDRDALLEKLKIPTKSAFFNTYGVGETTQGGSFMRNLSFNTSVPPNLATMITIGATSQGYVLGSDSTALSKMNNGLEDRFKKSIESPSVPKTTEATSSVENDYKQAIQAYNVFRNELSIQNNTKAKFNLEAINAFKQTQTQLVEYDQYKQTQAASTGNTSSLASPNSGFLPFDLQITLDGLSGMKVYQKYSIDTAFLPTNYPESLEFIIKGITDKIENNQWTTTLESIAIPKNPFGATIGESTVSAGSKKESRRETTSNVEYFQSNLPEGQAKFRARLTRILDDGTQTLGILEIYNPEGNSILYRLTTVELPWIDNLNGKSCIPTGEYLINSRQTSKYGKHFWLVGSKLGNWNRIPGTNPTDRTWVLIHTAPKAPGWLAGCIGPGPSFNFKRKNSKGNPDGIGTSYLEPAKSESKLALNRLVDTLWNDKGFKMIIENIDGVSSTNLPKSFNDPKIQKLSQDIRFKNLFK